MRPFIEYGLRVGVFLVVSLLAVSPLGMAQSSLSLTDTVRFDSLGLLENREGIGALFTMGKLVLSGQAAFKMDYFQGATLGTRFAQGPVQFRSRASFDQMGFKKGKGEATIKINGLSLAGSTTLGLKGLKKSVFKANMNVGSFVVQGMALFQATTVTGLFSTVSYAKTFGCWNLASTTRFAGSDFTRETFALTTSREGLKLGNTWIVTSKGWTGGLITVDGNFGLLHLTSTASWDLKGIEEGQLDLRALLNELQVKSTLKFNREGVTSWSALAQLKQKNTILQGALFATGSGLQGRLQASTAINGIHVQSELVFTNTGFRRASTGIETQIGGVEISGSVAFSPQGFTGEMKVEVRNILRFIPRKKA